MSSGSSRNSSPSISPEPATRRATLVIPETTERQTPPNSQNLVETPQSLAGPRSQSTPPDLQPSRQTVTSHPRAVAPLVIISKSSGTRNISEPEYSFRQSRSLVARRTIARSSSQPPHRYTPYARPSPQARARSQPRSVPSTTRATMSSASSSPGNTSTSGGASSSGSNPSYQLPYAPFPYPMPANGRGSGQNQQGGSNGSGK